MRPPTNDAGKDRATPSFLDANVFTAGRNNHANDYEAAMKAAEAVFARSVPTAPRPETNRPLNAPVGRVLPSLIENSVAPTIRLVEADEKPARGRAAGSAKAVSRVQPKKPTVQPEPAVTQDSVEQSATKIAPETLIASDHQRRSLQKRRILDASLKAGEKWKRRLCKAAR
jgi:hypothetical protein